jgi:hypothetical protein
MQFSYFGSTTAAPIVDWRGISWNQVLQNLGVWRPYSYSGRNPNPPELTLMNPA